MARDFRLLYVLWLVVANLGTGTSTTVPPATNETTISLSPTTTMTTIPPTTKTTMTTIPPTTKTTTTTIPPTTKTTTTTIPPTTKTTITTTTIPPTTKTTTTMTTIPPTTKTTTTTIPPTTKTTTTMTTIPPTTKTTTTMTTIPPTTKTTTTTTTIPPTTKTTIAPTTKTTTNATTISPSSTTTTTTTTTVRPAPTTINATATQTTLTTTTKPPGPCDSNPCGRGSTCEIRANQTYVCLCLPGEIYNKDRNSCETAKVFPGQLILPLQYNDKMSDKTSPEFAEASENITNELSNIFGESDTYTGSIVLELRPTASRAAGGVSASIEITFSEKSDITTEQVQESMVKATNCDGCLLAGGSFNETQLCSKDPCDVQTTECKSKNGLYNCTCKESYVRTDFSVRMCIACPSGQKAEGSVKCVSCPFGYSGLNCNESWQLVLVIVGSVLGGLLLITLILLPVVATINSKKSSKNDKHADNGNSYKASSPAKAPLVNSSFAANKLHSANGSSFTSAGMPTIPRATTTSHSNTNLEMTPSNSQQNLISADRNSRLYDNHDEIYPYSQSRPHPGGYGGYGQTRPQNNPYARNPPQINPYAQSQGRTNPYYTHNDGR